MKRENTSKNLSVHLKCREKFRGMDDTSSFGKFPVIPVVFLLCVEGEKNKHNKVLSAHSICRKIPFSHRKLGGMGSTQNAHTGKKNVFKKKTRFF